MVGANSKTMNTPPKNSYRKPKGKSPKLPQPFIADYKKQVTRSKTKKQLAEEYEGHVKNFDNCYKQQLFELGEIELRREEQNKYAKFHGQAKMTYLALNQKSRKRLKNAYF